MRKKCLGIYEYNLACMYLQNIIIILRSKIQQYQTALIQIQIKQTSPTDRLKPKS